MRTATLHDTLKAAVGRATGAVAANRFRAVLVTSELALALILLIGSGLMVKAFWKLQEVNAGMQSESPADDAALAAFGDLQECGQHQRLLRRAGGAVEYAARRGFGGDRERTAAGATDQCQRHDDRGLRPGAQRADTEYRLLEFGFGEILRDDRRAPAGRPLPQRRRWRDVSAGGGGEPDDGEDLLAAGERDWAPRADRRSAIAVADDRGRGGRCEECGARPAGGHGTLLSIRAAAATTQLGGGADARRPDGADGRGARCDTRAGPGAADFEYRLDGRRDVDGAFASALPDAAADAVLVALADIWRRSAFTA